MTRVNLFCVHFQIHSFEREEEGMAAGPVLGTKVFTHLQERQGKRGWGGGGGSDTNAPYEKNRLDQQLVGGEAKANLFTRSLKYKLQEARTFWWTSNSLPSTIIFRSVNSFALRCWFSSFNISVEQEKETDNATFGFRISSLTHEQQQHDNKEQNKMLKSTDSRTQYCQPVLRNSFLYMAEKK